MKKLRINKYPKYKDYPFSIEGLNFTEPGVVFSRPEKKMVVNTGETFEMATVYERAQKVLDQAKFIKIFPSGIKMLPTLGKSGMALFCYILNNVKPGKFEVDLSHKDVFKSYPSLTVDRYYVALRELLHSGFIARKDTYGPIYFINVNYFFNGDRRKGRKKIMEEKV